jgi:2-haloacid dehalogenase
LENAKFSSLLDEVVSAYEMKTLTPRPGTYAHAMRRLKHGNGAFWLISSNPFDIVGSKTAGLRTA